MEKSHKYRKKFKKRILISIIMSVVGFLILRFSHFVISGLAINLFWKTIGLFTLGTGIYLFFRNLWSRIY